ncbi:MAG TPA: hypothetical protein VGQ46_10475 [Thermoanaerobaculia bacterium]|jgi:hypothetical protein|nr:hypothetical protein [Thermoanaerobaculia bacterium]
MKRVLFTFIATLFSLPAAAQLQLQYATKALHVTGASAAGDVAIIGVIRSNDRGKELISEVETVEHADAAGNVSVAVPRLSEESVWLLVDIRTGQHIVSSPAHYQARQVPVPADAIDHFGRALLHTRPWTIVFIVRKGVGAWRVEGSDVDVLADPRNARVTLNPDRVKPIHGTPPAPQLLTPGDIVMAFDVPFMQFWVAKLTPADLPGAP